MSALIDYFKNRDDLHVTLTTKFKDSKNQALRTITRIHLPPRFWKYTLWLLCKRIITNNINKSNQTRQPIKLGLKEKFPYTVRCMQTLNRSLMAMLLQENSTHAFKYMYVKYRTAPFFLRCHLGPQYQYLGLCLAPVNACNSHLQTVSVTFSFYPPHLYPSLPPSILEHRWMGEGNHDLRQSAFFRTSILYEIISKNNEYPRSNCSSCTRGPRHSRRWFDPSLYISIPKGKQRI